MLAFVVYRAIGWSFPYCFFDSPAVSRKQDLIKYVARTYIVGAPLGIIGRLMLI